MVERDQKTEQSAANINIPSQRTMFVRDLSVPVVFDSSKDPQNPTVILLQRQGKSWIYEKDENQVHATSDKRCLQAIPKDRLRYHRTYPPKDRGENPLRQA